MNKTFGNIIAGAGAAAALANVAPAKANAQPIPKADHPALYKKAGQSMTSLVRSMDRVWEYGVPTPAGEPPIQRQSFQAGPDETAYSIIIPTEVAERTSDGTITDVPGEYQLEFAGQDNTDGTLNFKRVNEVSATTMILTDPSSYPIGSKGAGTYLVTTVDITKEPSSHVGQPQVVASGGYEDGKTASNFEWIVATTDPQPPINGQQEELLTKLRIKQVSYQLNYLIGAAASHATVYEMLPAFNPAPSSTSTSNYLF